MFEISALVAEAGLAGFGPDAFWIGITRQSNQDTTLWALPQV
jgi:hypothetical protein